MNNTQHTWKGKWIGADMTVEDRFAPVFKKTFSVSEKHSDAKAYICGLGLFELKINGILPDDSVLNPAHTQYSKTVLYRVFDVSSLIREGENEITVELGNSFFNDTTYVWNWDKASWRSAPKMIFDLEISYADGTAEAIASDESWLVSKNGATTENSIYLGETFDARKLDMRFDSNAIAVSSPDGILKEQTMPPIRRIARFKPEKIEKISENCYIITAPEMISGWASLRINEPVGKEITVTYSERLNDDGHVHIIGKGEGRDGNWWPQGYIQQDRFISDGNEHTFEPKFSYKGFRYIQIENCSADLTEEDITLYRIANDVRAYSEFSCSDDMLNKLHKLLRTTLLNNFQGKPTDTPVWEKNGWLGDLNCALDSIMYNFDMSSFLASFVDTMADCFDEFGSVPVMVPSANWSIENSPVWNTVFVFAAEALINYCGMTDYAKNLYPALRKFALKDIEELGSNDWVWGFRGLSDWVSPVGDENAPIEPGDSEGAEICGTAFIYAMLISMKRIAETFGKAEDAEEYGKAATNIFNAFNSKFYNAQAGIYETTFWRQKGTRTKYRQTSNLVPLAFGLVPDECRENVVKNLVADIVSKDYHLDTGCVGTKFILPVLFDCGYADAAYKVLTQTTYPSWGYWLENGATSAWESWEKTTRSQNHYFLATYEEAFYSHIAGIRNIRNGFREFTLSPAFDCGLDWAKAEFGLPHGKLSSEWKKNSDGSIEAVFEIPDGALANAVLRANGGEYKNTLSGGSYSFIIKADGRIITE